jgi:hypothetical protein
VERFGFNPVPSDAVASSFDTHTFQTLVIGGGKTVMAGRRYQVEPATTTQHVTRTLKSTQEETLESAMPIQTRDSILPSGRGPTRGPLPGGHTKIKASTMRRMYSERLDQLVDRGSKRRGACATNQ